MAKHRGRIPRPPEERFWTKVDRSNPDGCWLWTATCYPNGYGQFRIGSQIDGTRRTVLAHRFAYEQLVGPIPEGLTLDHVETRGCISKACVNPAHLEPVMQVENVRRWAVLITYCPHGHPYDEANTRIRKNRVNGRCCRACDRDRHREQRG